MDFSVIICTYNRSQNLPKATEYLSRLEGTREFRWEVFIVDNNSNDDTRDVVEKPIGSSDIKLRYVFEPQQGLNYARNRGIQESESRYFCYIDDDILVGPNWLASLYRALESNGADAVGGRIHLDPDIELPSWISPEIQGFLGYLDYGEKPFRMDGKIRYPYGGNMSFNRRLVDKIGMFNSLLGRKGEGRKRKELFKGAETGDVDIYYEPDAIVYHKITPHQLQIKYFLTIHYNAGLQKAYYDEASFPRRILGVPLFIIPQFARSVGKYLAQIATRGPDSAFRQLMTVGHFLGMITGNRKAHREAS